MEGIRVNTESPMRRLIGTVQVKGDDWLDDSSGDQRCSDLGRVLKAIVLADRILGMSMRERAVKGKSKIFHPSTWKNDRATCGTGKAEDGVGKGKGDHTFRPTRHLSGDVK